MLGVNTGIFVSLSKATSSPQHLVLTNRDAAGFWLSLSQRALHQPTLLRCHYNPQKSCPDDVDEERYLRSRSLLSPRPMVTPCFTFLLFNPSHAMSLLWCPSRPYKLPGVHKIVRARTKPEMWKAGWHNDNRISLKWRNASRPPCLKSIAFDSL